MRTISRMKLASSLVVASCLASCLPDDACTLVGCNSGLGVDVPGLGADAFAVDVESPTFSGTVACPALDANGLRQSPTETTGDLAGDDRIVEAACDANGVTLSFLRADSELPSAATFVVTSGDRTFTATSNDIGYAVSQPNGPSCEPTCSFAVLVAQPS